MGASGWSNFTPWQKDAGNALEALRAEVFAKGEYGETRQWDQAIRQMQAAGQDVKQLQQLVEQRRALEPAGKPQTIAEALEQAAEEGTHSVLDIMAGISQGPDFGTAFPAPQEWLLRAYGTLRPTRQMVEEKGFEPAEELERWSCTFFAVWDGDGAEGSGDPRWWYFEGCSGD